MKKKEDGIVRVGGKPESAYVSAVLYCLDRYGEAKLQGLGYRQGKVLSIAESVSRINGAVIRTVDSIQVEDMRGLEIIIKWVGGGKGE